MSRILVIDDDRSVRHLIAKAFEESDVEVVPAASAGDAEEAGEAPWPGVRSADALPRSRIAHAATVAEHCFSLTNRLCLVS